MWYMVFNGGAKMFGGEKTVSSTKDLRALNNHMQKNEVVPLPYTIYSQRLIQHRWETQISDLKLLEKIKGEKLCDIGFGLDSS